MHYSKLNLWEIHDEANLCLTIYGSCLLIQFSESPLSRWLLRPSENRTKLSRDIPGPNWRQSPDLLYGHPVFGTRNELISRAPSEACEWQNVSSSIS